MDENIGENGLKIMDELIEESKGIKYLMMRSLGDTTLFNTARAMMDENIEDRRRLSAYLANL